MDEREFVPALSPGAPISIAPMPNITATALMLRTRRLPIPTSHKLRLLKYHMQKRTRQNIAKNSGNKNSIELPIQSQIKNRRLLHDV